MTTGKNSMITIRQSELRQTSWPVPSTLPHSLVHNRATVQRRFLNVSALPRRRQHGTRSTITPSAIHQLAPILYWSLSILTGSERTSWLFTHQDTPTLITVQMTGRATLVSQLLTRGRKAEAPPLWARSALIVLIEAAHRWPHLVENQLIPVLYSNPRLAIAAGGVALARLVQLSDIPDELLQGIAQQAPMRPNADLDHGIAVLIERIVDNNPKAMTDPATRTYLFWNLCWRYENAGRHADAVDSGRLSVEAARVLLDSGLSAEAANMLLAACLLAFGAALYSVGRFDEAVAAAREAINKYSELSSDGVNWEFDSGAAVGLSNLGAYLSFLGKHQDALLATEESVKINRRLARRNVALCLPDLAAALTNLTLRLCEVDRYEEALAAAVEAVKIYQRLAFDEPDSYLPGLAAALDNQAIALSTVERYSDAAVAADRAINIYYRLVNTNKLAFEVELARALTNRGHLLSQLKRFEDAALVSAQAVEMWRSLARSNPEAYSAELAKTLFNLEEPLWELGRQTEALAAMEESEAIYRRLSELVPDLYEPKLMETLLRLSDRFTKLDNTNKNIAVLTMAITLKRRQARSYPTAESELAALLNNLGNYLNRTGRLDEALVASDESVAIRRRLTDLDPALYRADLARSLTSKSGLLWSCEQYAAAVANAEEAVQIA